VRKVTAPASAGTVPTVSADLSSVQLGDVSGFRGQEAWGRWTLGKVAALELNAQEAGWAAAHLKVNLPYARQSLQLWLGDTSLGQVRSMKKFTSYDVWLALPLRKGVNELRLLTDKSNLDPRLQPFAPQDRTDMGIALEQLLFEPVQPQHHAAPGQLYSTFRTAALKSYDAVLDRQAILFVQNPGDHQLRYSVLANAEGQSFQIRLGQDVLSSFSAPHAGSLMTGAVSLRVGERQPLTISATSASDSRPDGAVRTGPLIDELGGQSAFYIQRFAVTPQSPWQDLERPGAVVGALALIVLLGLLLLKRTADC
jgi:hypothetical protein